MRPANVLLRPWQTNAVITVNLIDKVDNLVRSDCHVRLQMLAAKVDVVDNEGGADNCSRQIALSESVHALDSEATH